MINTVTLNPAIDTIIYLDNLQKNMTNRIKYTQNVVGGKGTHVSVNLKILGLENRAFGIGFGDTGKKVIDYLTEDGVFAEFILKNYGCTRVNYLIIEENNDCTLIANKGETITDEILNELLSLMKDNINNGDCIVLSGDASNCKDPMVYNKIIENLADKKLKIFLDTSGENLKKSLSISPFLIKPNLDELSFLCSKKLETNKEIIKSLFDLKKYNIDVISLSLGKRGSMTLIDDTIYECIAPDVSVINTIGCGDAFLSALIYGFHNNKSHEDIVRLATAVSSAAAETPISVGFDLQRANDLMECIVINKIK